MTQDSELVEAQAAIEAAQNGADLPVTEIVSKFYDELSEQGFGRNDTSALIRRLRD